MSFYDVYANFSACVRVMCWFRGSLKRAVVVPRMGSRLEHLESGKTVQPILGLGRPSLGCWQHSGLPSLLVRVVVSVRGCRGERGRGLERDTEL